jgi:hypothetical protein
LTFQINNRTIILMEEKSFVARLLEKKTLLLLIGGLILLPIILIASNTKTGLFSRASSSTENGFQVLSVDPQTGEYYDLLIAAYPFKPVIENNIANKATVGFQIYGARVVTAKTLYGAIQKPDSTEYTKTFNFTTEGAGTAAKFISEELTLADNPNYGCIDLHSDASRTKENYIASFCYTLGFFNRPSTSPARIYSLDGRLFVETMYKGTKPAGVISMTTGFNKYTNSRAPNYTGNFKGSRVNYFSHDDNSNSKDFTDNIYNIQGVTNGLSEAESNELCTIGTQYPDKYLRYGNSLWYEGGDLIKLENPGSGGCSFEIKQPTLLRGWMNLWTETMFKQPQPSAPLTKAPTTIALTQAALSKTPTTRSARNYPFCQIDSRLPTSQDDKNLTVNIKAQGGPGTAWRLTRSMPLQEVAKGTIVNNKIEFTSTLQWGVRYTLQIQTSANRWYSSPGCFFFYDKPSSATSGVPTKAATPIPTKTWTPTPVPSTANPSPVTQKTWTFNLIAQCPSGTVIKSAFKPGWYWWDSIDGSDADVATSAIVSGLSDRLFYFRIFDNGGTLKPIAPSSNMSVTSENYLRWNGTYSSGTYTIRYEARASSCSAQ